MKSVFSRGFWKVKQVEGELALHATQRVLNPVEGRESYYLLPRSSELPCEGWKFMGGDGKRPTAAGS